MWTRSFAVVLVTIMFVAGARADDDPQTLDEVVAKVREMKANAASNREMAEYVNGVVDRRIVNDNGFEGIWKRGFIRKDKDAVELFKDFEAKIRPQIQKTATPGREYEAFANWAWKNRYGQCAENSAIVYFIFKNADIPVKLFERPGHAFAAIGIDKGFKSTDLTTYGDDAYFVDPWLGRVAKATTAGELEHSGKLFTGLLQPWGPTKDERRQDVPGYDNPATYERFMANAYLEVTVISEKNGAPLAGARVTLTSTATEEAFGARELNGRYIGYFKPGEYTVIAMSADGKHKAPAQLATLQLATKNELFMQVRDGEEVDAGTEEAPPSPDDWAGLWKGTLTEASSTGAVSGAATGQPVTLVIEKSGAGLRVSATTGPSRATTFALAFVDGTAYSQAKSQHNESGGTVRYEALITATMPPDRKKLVVRAVIKYIETDPEAAIQSFTITGAAELTRVGQVKSGK